MELPVSSDLSDASLNHAIDILNKEYNDLKWHSTHVSAYETLRIPSQLMGFAWVLRVNNRFHIEPSFTYGTDEWSYHKRAFNTDTKVFDELIVWSSGA